MTIQNGSVKPGSAKPPQVLEILPSDQLKFEGPFRDIVTSELQLINKTERRVCFKVKSNAPVNYFVKPTGALIEPHSEMNVTIMLQSPDGVHPKDSDHHKFLVQSIFAPDNGPIDSLEKLWKRTKQEEIMETKIPCTFIDRQTTTSFTSYENDSSVHRSHDSESRSVPESSKGQHESSSGLFVCVLALLFVILAFIVYKMAL